jgi:hypothetical protein
VTDAVTGVNLRLVDNLVQLVAIIVFAAIGAAIGHAVGDDVSRMIVAGTFGRLGLIVGGMAGLLLGLVTSGLVIGIHRAVRTARTRRRARARDDA